MSVLSQYILLWKCAYYSVFFLLQHVILSNYSHIIVSAVVIFNLTLLHLIKNRMRQRNAQVRRLEKEAEVQREKRLRQLADERGRQVRHDRRVVLRIRMFYMLSG